MSKPASHTRLLDQMKQFPHNPGVYLFKDPHGQVIYVGKAKDLRKRIQSYFREGGDGRHQIQFLMQRAASLDNLVTETEQEALILENNLIKKHRPRYNIFLKDDKTYVNLRLNVKHPYPRLTVVRNPKSDGAQYFGPFASAGSVRATLRMIGRIFPLRTCTDHELNIRKRPCLYYHIKRCPGPCAGLIDPQEYRETVGKVTMFLKGKGNELARSLKKKMDVLAAERRYEQAARVRDQVRAIQRTIEKQRITSPQTAERDVFGTHRDKETLVIQVLFVRSGQLSGGEAFTFTNASLPTEELLSSFLSQYYQRGAVIPGEVVVAEPIPDPSSLSAYLSYRKKEKVPVVCPQRGERRQMAKLARKNAALAAREKGPSARSRDLLEDLRELLSLKKFPRRIECFDVSNIQGRDAVASCATFIDGEPARNLYRRYKIKTVEGADDYGMLEETLERRLVRGIKEGDLPDLLLLDGGRGQLNVALRVLARLGVDELDALGIAKVRDRESRRRIKGREKIFHPDLADPLLLEGNSTALLLLQRIRDEAHRFAITYHQKLRSRKMEHSILDDIPGVGPVLKQRLLYEFGSLARLRQASAETIAQLPGVSKSLAGRIKDFLH
jgi:excinuclease ABC subunit C